MASQSLFDRAIGILEPATQLQSAPNALADVALKVCQSELREYGIHAVDIVHFERDRDDGWRTVARSSSMDAAGGQTPNLPDVGSLAELQSGCVTVLEPGVYARAFALPHRKDSRIGLVLHGATPPEGRKENALLVLIYLGALRFFGVIDSATLREWYGLYRALTPATALVVHDLVTSERVSVMRTSQRLGLSKRTIENQVRQVSRNLQGKGTERRDDASYASPLLDLIRSYFFLQFAGRPAVSPPPAE